MSNICVYQDIPRYLTNVRYTYMYMLDLSLHCKNKRVDSTPLKESFFWPQDDSLKRVVLTLSRVTLRRSSFYSFETTLLRSHFYAFRRTVFTLLEWLFWLFRKSHFYAFRRTVFTLLEGPFWLFRKSNFYAFRRTVFTLSEESFIRF